MSAEKEQFINDVARFAQKYMRTTGVPASLTIAQAILESNWGRSGLSRNNKNLFGIKGPGRAYETKEFVNGKEISVTASFRSYDTYEGSIKDHNEMLKRMSRYQKVLFERDYKKACHAIQSAGYATDPNYAVKLIGIIETYQLTKYDDWEDEAEMKKEDADELIKVCQEKWGAAKTQADKDKWHRLANALREASGQK